MHEKKKTQSDGVLTVLLTTECSGRGEDRERRVWRWMGGCDTRDLLIWEGGSSQRVVVLCVVMMCITFSYFCFILISAVKFQCTLLMLNVHLVVK